MRLPRSRPWALFGALAAGFWGTVALATNLVRDLWDGYQYRAQTDFNPVPLDGHFAGNDVFLLAIWAGLSLLAWRAWAVKDRRTRRMAALVGLLAAAAETVGAALNWDNSLHLLFSSPIQLVKTAIHLTGYWVIFYTAFAVILDASQRSAWKPRQTASIAWQRLRSVWRNHRRWFVAGVWLALCLSRLPYFLAWFPAAWPVDANAQLQQFLTGQITSHHPLLHTVILGLFGKLGQAVGSITLGIAAYSVVLILVSSAAYTYVIMSLKSWGVRPGAVVGAGAFYALWPLFSMHTMNPMKDVPFALGAMCLVTALISAARDGRAFWSKPGHWVAVIGFSLMVTLWRSNGVHVMAFALVLLIAFAKGQRKQFLVVAGVTALVFGIIQGPVHSAVLVGKGDPREAWSLPAQQVARAVQEHATQLTDEEWAQIHAIFSDPTWVSEAMPIEDAYHARLSDWVKNQINTEYVKTHRQEVLDLYWDLGRKYPKSYLSAAVAQGFGFWYPEAIEPASQAYVTDNQWGITEGDSLAPRLRAIMLKLSLTSARPVPIASMLFSAGFYAGVLVLAAASLLLKRRRQLLLALTPLAGIWLTAMLSPAFAEFRYVLALAMSAPLVALAAWYSQLADAAGPSTHSAGATSSSPPRPPNAQAVKT